jgi:hypothetical protein
MSLALATKGIISGIGFGSGTGEGGLYPDDYVASAIEVAVDMSEEVNVTVEESELSVEIELSEETAVAINISEAEHEVSLDEETVGVNTCSS